MARNLPKAGPSKPRGAIIELTPFLAEETPCGRRWSGVDTKRSSTLSGLAADLGDNVTVGWAVTPLNDVTSAGSDLPNLCECPRQPQVSRAHEQARIMKFGGVKWTYTDSMSFACPLEGLDVGGFGFAASGETGEDSGSPFFCSCRFLSCPWNICVNATDLTCLWLTMALARAVLAALSSADRLLELIVVKTM
jgi:hypothetical protein